MILTWKKEDSFYSAVFEDNGRVAYGYLIHDDDIVGDVWLYNRIQAPDEPEWTSPENLPFANPKGFVKDEFFAPVKSESDVDITWAEDEASEITLLINIRNQVIAKIKHGSKPGWNKLAIKDGPLAKAFN